MSQFMVQFLFEIYILIKFKHKSLHCFYWGSGGLIPGGFCWGQLLSGGLMSYTTNLDIAYDFLYTKHKKNTKIIFK